MPDNTAKHNATAPLPQTPPPSPRHALRRYLKQARKAQSPAAMQQASHRIRQHLAIWLADWRAARTATLGQPLPRAQLPCRIAAFWPLPFEPDLVPLLRRWASTDGLSIALPAVVSDMVSDDLPDVLSDAESVPLSFRLWTPDTVLRTGAFNIQEPRADSAPAPLPDVVLVPTLGFARAGHRIDRIGYGQGHYDRTLAYFKHSGQPFVSVGVAWACGEVIDPAYAPAAHDMPLDAIVTECGVRSTAQQPSQPPAPLRQS